ncbi:MAG: hypothetical protein C4297_05510 [Gemmataceae bacterium]
MSKLWQALNRHTLFADALLSEPLSRSAAPSIGGVETFSHRSEPNTARTSTLPDQHEAPIPFVEIPEEDSAQPCVPAEPEAPAGKAAGNGVGEAPTESARESQKTLSFEPLTLTTMRQELTGYLPAAISVELVREMLPPAEELAKHLGAAKIIALTPLTSAHLPKAVALVAALSLGHHTRCLLIDATEEGLALGAVFAQPEAPGLRDWLAGVPLGRVIRNTTLPRCHILPAGLPLAFAADASGKRLSALAAWVRRRYDLTVFLSSAPNGRGTCWAVLRSADALVLVSDEPAAESHVELAKYLASGLAPLGILRWAGAIGTDHAA